MSHAEISATQQATSSHSSAQKNELMNNPYNYYVEIIIALLMGNIGTTESHANELNILTTTTQQLTASWLSNNPGGANMATALKAVTNSSQMQNFITTWLTGPNLDDFSSDFGIQVMTALSNNWDSSKSSPSSILMNTVNQWISLISSTSQEETSTGQNLTNTENSVVQQDASAQQGFSDMGTAVNEVCGNYASLLQQSY